ncbi:TonB-dependent receptor [Neiella marina]|uniref:TonB-dependent receptor n=1 Tax=Neiella holothuriorum TaxID=2870530 RepID=A0ABS7EJL6_9GAMM|nr:TonB-dependent receptor [Neiella holothuriorum]MBW8191857.1 TonB-dependent receptor [Neiella holothuriorum]
MSLKNLKYTALFAAVSSAFSAPIQAEDDAEVFKGLERITVSATRRVNTVQDIPVNITALNGDLLEDNRITDLVEISKWVPGMTVVDQGGRAPSPIIVRGLNTGDLGPTGENSGGGTVGTYLGEVPVYVDLHMYDMNRVEVLIGPQGTLYGAGTLAGAIRYLPNKPSFDGFEITASAGLSQTKESDDPNYEATTIINVPISDTFALRASVGYDKTAGFIDYNYLVQEAGVSNPQPDFSDPADVAANLTSKEDANGNETLFGRFGLRWAPLESVDVNLTYFYQKDEPEGRTMVHTESFGTGKYESGYRFEEPNKMTNKVISLEVEADLDFASLVVALGKTDYEELGQRDQTDLLLNFEYGYEGFPSFAAFTREIADEDTFTGEVRLVSQADSKLSWIVGAFYNKLEVDSSSEEFTPGIPEFWDIDRPDNLEYMSILEETIKEKAVFGELSYEVTDDLTITLGARAYDYEDDVEQGFALPLLDGEPVDILFNMSDGSAEDDGTLFKFNASYQAAEDILTYFTVSEGYRIGGGNAVAPCDEDLELQQNVCATADELFYEPDETLNFELGTHSTLLDNTLELNAALYFIKWDKPQVPTITENGSVTITTNGPKAESKGVELSSRYLLSENWMLFGTYAYTNAELTEDAPGLVEGADAFSGDRLPGSPEHQASFGTSYSAEIGGMPLELGYNLQSMGNIYTKVGKRNNGEALGGYTIHNLSARLSYEEWDFTLYADNFTDKYAATSVRTDYASIRDVNGFDLRRYGKYVNTPRTVGLRVKYNFAN